MIPASQDVNVLPGVVGAGGNPLSLNAVMLTSGQFPPMGQVPAFASAAAVSSYFGPGSAESAAAAVYFNGFLTSTSKPGTLYFSRYPTTAVAGYLLGVSQPAMTLAQLQALGTGTITVSVNGTPQTSSSINLSTASSFSQAASTVQAALTGVTVTYSSQLSAFIIASNTTGAASTVGYATVGALATGLGLTQAAGAQLSAGAIAGVPATAMAAITAVTQNWATFMSTFDPDGGSGSTQKQAFATWSNSQNQRWLYVEWDNDPNAAVSGNTTNFGAITKAAAWNGVCANYSSGSASSLTDPTNPMLLAAFVCGTVASIDFNAVNGRITTKFKNSSQIQPGVTDQTTLNNLIANGYNCYGGFATANQSFQYYTPGQVPGQWLWLDNYVNQIYLNAQLQLANITGLTQVNSVPYNTLGYTTLAQFAQGPINQMVNFGGIQPGIPLSPAQIAEVNLQAGIPIDQVLSTRGWFYQVLPASSQSRSARTTPPCKLWYTDGGSVQQINIASLDVI